MSPKSVQQHPRETKSGVNVSQECGIHSWGAEEAKSVTEGIRRKPKVHKSVSFYIYICVSPASIRPTQLIDVAFNIHWFERSVRRYSGRMGRIVVWLAVS